MADDLPPELGAPRETLVDYETQSLERGTYIMAVVHLYRGEVARANAWRMRLDQTTNWAIFVTASALGFAFGTTEASHFSLQFANVLLFFLLTFEARRFRFFDVWRARIRKIESNFFAPILRRDLSSPEEAWAGQVARDLDEPHFHLTRIQAMRSRLVRNYLPIFGVVLAAWLIKLDIHPAPTTNFSELYDRCQLGTLPGWVIISGVALFYAMLLWILVFGRAKRRAPGLDNWDIGEIVTEESIP
ncbi:MAG: DUF2270 domain-containing protein [Planctomycetota bacterium]|jgi:uncharacterized membrane protein|nr:DUF2270 domain-containing protein [Planctomycetota bacterium]